MTVVHVVTLATGTRIEAFTADTHFFARSEDAHEFAHQQANAKEGAQVRRSAGNHYAGECTGGYPDWPDYAIWCEAFDPQDGAHLSISDYVPTAAAWRSERV